MTLGQILLIVIGHTGEKGLPGRTRLQKLVYFLSKRMHLPASYSPYYYGPYSEQVSASLESLVERGLIDENVNTFESDGPFEGKKYTYTLTEDGRAVMEALRRKHADEFQRISEHISALLSNAPSTRALAVASKLLILRERSREHAASPGKLRRLAEKFGWRDISNQDVRDGVDLLVKYGHTATELPVELY